MPFRKEKSRKTNSSGRPEKDPEDTLSGKSEEEQQKYYRHAMRKSRGKQEIQTPEKVPPLIEDDDDDSTDTSYSDDEKDEDDEGISSSPPTVGRPPLGDKAMTPNTRSERKRSLRRDQYQREKTSRKRSEAASKRWQMKLVFDRANEPMTDHSSEDDEETQVVQHDVVSLPDEDVLVDHFSERTYRHYKQKLQEHLSVNILVNLDLFVHYCKSHSSILDLDTSSYSLMGNLDQRRIRYHGDGLNKFLVKLRTDYFEKVLVYWLDILLQNKIVASVFEDQGWEIPEQYTPLHYKVELAASRLRSTFLKREQTSNDQRILGTRYVAEVIKVTGLTTQTTGGIQLLATYTNCSRKFAKSVLEAVEGNELETFIGRKTRCDSIHANRYWVDQISDFVLKPENSRAVPGQESISIKYGVRRPKYILRKPRAVIASEFLEANPTCPFKASTIMREFPQNAVTASQKDNKRNVCPYHSNVRRIINALHHNEVAMDVPSSVRGMCRLNMCADESIDESDPVQWNRDCATGKCLHCPAPSIVVPAEKAKKVISVSLWEYGVDEVKKKKQEAKAKAQAKDTKMEVDGESSEGKKKGKKKKVKADGRVFGLFRHVSTIEETAQLLVDKLVKMKSHVYNAYSQWNAHSQNRSSLDDASVITIEDYQQNLEIVYNETPTASVYSANKTSVALYPIVVEYKINGVLHKGAIVFVSDDKLHDMQQVSAFEERMFEIIRSKIPHEIVSWQRWTDGAGHEFRSRFCNSELIRLKKILNLHSLSFEYFEAHEGKNVSDALGSIVKNKVVRIMQEYLHGVRSSRELVELLSVMPDVTAKFSFLHIENFDQIKRVPANERDYIVMPNILKIHSIKAVDGGLLGLEQTCVKCSPSELCTTCVASPPTVVMADEVDDDDSDSEYERLTEDEDASDDGSDIEQEHHETESTNYGYPVWAKYLRSWYPAKVVSPSDIPLSLQHKLQSSEGLIAVYWYGEDRYSLVQRTNTDVLAQNRVDEVRAAVSEQMLIKYNLALSDVHND